MPRHFSVEDFSVGVPNHKEDVKRLEQDRSDGEKITSPNVADSGDDDHLFRSIVITGSGDRDHTLRVGTVRA
jgi:hypothetical protein